MADALGWALLLGVLGAVFGSHIATVAIRWPARATGRSVCDGCRERLRWRELVPIASWVVLRGRCAWCGSGIAPLHPAVELLGCAIGVLAGLAAPGLEGAAGAAFGWLLLTLAAIDLVALRLPNVLTLALALTGLATAALSPPAIVERLIGGAAGFGALWLVATLYRWTRGREGLGGGDPKLLGAIGLWLGWPSLPGVLLGASLIGLAAVAAMMLAGRRVAATDRLPFGTMLAASAWGAWLLARL